jgi:hypothetical protein
MKSKDTSLVWQDAFTTKPEPMTTVLAIDHDDHLWGVYWDDDIEDWFNAQGQDELPSLQWWAEINFPEHTP